MNMTATQIHTYRVWMKDGFAGLYDAETENDAMEKAIEYAKKSIEGCAMSASEKRKAVTVDYLEKLN